MGVIADLTLRETYRPLVARIDASRLDSTSLGRVTSKFRRVHLVTDLPDVRGIRIKLVPHREGTDNLAVSA
jgi:hypothetical protein